MHRRGQEAPATLTSADVAAGALRAGEPLGVYVHFPFCTVRCPYCDFAVDTRKGIPHDAYADAVIAEIVARAAWFAGAGPLVSIYVGGGTPGLWRAQALGRALEAARGAFGAGAAGDLEITLEVNPGEADEASLRALRAVGVNRLSIGVQALDDALLTGLGRNHTGAAGPAALRAARAAGFDNLSVDLMFGIPGQTHDDWRRTVDAVIGLAPEHVSAYALAVERGTAFGALDRRGQLARPEDGMVASMFEHARAAFAGAGLEPYEVSSYARAGRRSRHNQLYWALTPYLGVGASGASFRPLDDGGAWRFSNPRAVDVYLRDAAKRNGNPRPRHIERRTPTDLENEALWLGLRTVAGVDRAAHRARHGVDPVQPRQADIERARRAGWLAVDPNRLHLTPAGLLFADEVATRLWR
jgi:putative oxygen-independent coproporphyrinogen III oxidase